MKKMTWKMRLLGGLVAVSMLFAGCAQGADCDETFQSTVTNTQLESPDASSIAFALVTNAAGVEQVKASWPLSKGAGGYEVSVANVNDVNNPEYLLQNEVVDGTSVTFSLFEDTNYEISVRTLGNASFNNKEAETASVATYSSMIEGVTVPATEDLGAFITKYIADHAAELAANRAADPNYEIAFDLEPGATYQMATIADFGTQPSRVRGDRQNKPTIIIAEGSNAYFMTAGGLKLKFLNIDADGMDKENYGLIVMHTNPPADTKIGSIAYECDNPIRMEGCWVKNCRRSLISVGQVHQWGLHEFRVTDCIIQFKNTGSGAHKTIVFVYNEKTNTPKGQWQSGIRDTYFVNSTLTNVLPKDQIKTSAFFARFGNKDVSKLFGQKSGKFVIQNCTINRLWPNKNFADRVGGVNWYSTEFTNSIFWDTRLIQKMLNSSLITVENNTIWGITTSVDNTDKTKYAKEEDPGFTEEEATKELDFTQPNGGLNFTPTTGNGDPRWLK